MFIWDLLCFNVICSLRNMSLWGPRKHSFWFSVLQERFDFFICLLYLRSALAAYEWMRVSMVVCLLSAACNKRRTVVSLIRCSFSRLLCLTASDPALHLRPPHHNLHHASNKCLIISETMQAIYAHHVCCDHGPTKGLYYWQSDDLDLRSQSQVRLKFYFLTCNISDNI